jgi:hypothetical protein
MPDRLVQVVVLTEDLDREGVYQVRPRGATAASLANIALWSGNTRPLPPHGPMTFVLRVEILAHPSAGPLLHDDSPSQHAFNADSTTESKLESLIDSRGAFLGCLRGVRFPSSGWLFSGSGLARIQVVFFEDVTEAVDFLS